MKLKPRSPTLAKQRQRNDSAVSITQDPKLAIHRQCAHSGQCSDEEEKQEFARDTVRERMMIFGERATRGFAMAVP